MNYSYCSFSLLVFFNFSLCSLPKSDQHLISPNSNAAKSFIEIMRIKEMITDLKGFDCYSNSPFQYKRKNVEKSVENIDADVRVLKV